MTQEQSVLPLFPATPSLPACRASPPDRSAGGGAAGRVECRVEAAGGDAGGGGRRARSAGNVAGPSRGRGRSASRFLRPSPGRASGGWQGADVLGREGRPGPSSAPPGVRRCRPPAPCPPGMRQWRSPVRPVRPVRRAPARPHPAGRDPRVGRSRRRRPPGRAGRPLPLPVPRRVPRPGAPRHGPIPWADRTARWRVDQASGLR
jgi:translation initiation factor IF-2